MGVIILDIDNTIADDAWRIPHINWAKRDPDARYHPYHLLSGFDAAGNRHLFESDDHAIALFTARPTTYEPLTREWLRRNGVRHEWLLMRNPGDHRPSADLKLAQLAWLLTFYGVHRSEIVGAFDDRADVVAAYRAAGLTAAQVAIHSVCAYTPPREQRA